MKKLKKIYIEITNSCNLNCVFCIKNSREIKFVTFDEFKIILKKVKKYTDYLYFHLLGEPLLHPLINEFIDYASAEGFNINITTNGYLISKIKHNKNIRQLNVSLHSFDLKYNKSLKDYMSDILTSAECLAKNNTYISFRFWVDNPNSNYMIEILNSYFKTNIKLDEFKENLKIIENIFINKFHIFNWPNLDNSYYCEY